MQLQIVARLASGKRGCVGMATPLSWGCHALPELQGRANTDGRLGEMEFSVRGTRKRKYIRVNPRNAEAIETITSLKNIC